MRTLGHDALRSAATLPVLVALMLAGCGHAGENASPTQSVASPAERSASGSTVPLGFTVTSPAFAENTRIPAEYSCKGRNVSPALKWRNTPPGTESLALVVDDPDAPAGLFVHWVVTAIPSSVAEIGEDALPAGAVVSLSSADKAEYLGPCPPAGTGVHHYRFRLYALRKPLSLTPTTPVPESTTTIANLSVAVAGTVGLFGS